GWNYRGIYLVLLVALVLSGMAVAQDDMPPGRVSFAGGQMVRGTVTSVAADHLAVKTEEGEIYQIVVSNNTRIMKGRTPVKLTDIKTGDGVGAMGVMDVPTKSVHAVFVAVVDAEQVKKAREDMGKTYITGQVTAVDMDNARITVKRPDGVSQTIQADESTSFKRGGRRQQASENESSAADATAESITLADIKTGDYVGGRGSVKNGMFVPTELRVMHQPPGGMGRRHANMAPAPATNSNTQNLK
ncbi:MAG TPA: hypothetical protein VFE38_05715, partial [Edaphobacter sp.]|nr:hypothetical protein [Edaphobacter sp.]